MMFSSREVFISHLSQMMANTNEQLVFGDHNSLFGQENGSGLNPINHFPSYDHGGFNDLPAAGQLMATTTTTLPPPPTGPPLPGDVTTNMSTCVACRSGRKRAVRRDRHSKILTKSGPRDRRMRLSLDVAEKFFNLQDKLGYDKASKTVEWLLTKSKGAIKSLTACGSRSEHRRSSSGNPKMESSTSECEVDKPVVMDNDDDNDDDGEERAVAGAAAAAAVEGGHQVHVAPKSRRPSTTRTSRKLTSDPMLTKVSRAQKRARARERTMEKRMWSSRFESGTFQKQYLGGEVEHPNNDWKRSSTLGGGGQSLPAVVMGHDVYEGLISTSDPINYNHHHHNIHHLHNPDPFNSLQEYCSLHTSSAATADAVGEQRATIDAHIRARGWEEEINHGSII